MSELDAEHIYFLQGSGAVSKLLGLCIKNKYKEAATMLHPDKQHGRDEAARRRTAMAWQRVSEAYDRVMIAPDADAPGG